MRTKTWTYSIILSVVSVVSFFLPWFESRSRSSFGEHSFSQSLQGSPADALMFYIQWLIFSSLCVLLAFKKSRWAVIPAFLNFYPVFSAIGFFGKGNSISYSAYGASASASSGLAYGFWIFAGTTLLFFIATIGELFKNKSVAIEYKNSSSVKEGYIQPKTSPQNKRSLEELKQAKDLLDAGTISQEEFDSIKAQALGIKIQPKSVQKELPKVSPSEPVAPKQEKIFAPAPAGVDISSNKKSISKRWIYIGGSVVVFVLVFLLIKYFTRSSEHEIVLAEAPSTQQSPADELTQAQLDEQEALADRNDHESGVYPDFDKLFTGIINNKYSIEMRLSNASGSLSGDYHYIGKETRLKLVGNISSDGSIELYEYADGLNTGAFTGMITDNAINGQWTTPDKQKVYSFTVSEVQGGQSVYQLLQGKWQSEDDPKSYKIFNKFTMIDSYEGNTESEKDEYVLSDECLNDSDKGSVSEKDEDKYISLLKSDMCFHIDHIDGQSLSLVYMGRGNFLNYRKVSEETATSSSAKNGFLSTGTGERYKMINIQVPNHDEAGSTSEIEVTGPVEGMYICKSEGKSRSIQINYDGDKIYVLHWNDSENAKREDAYITSKGYLAFGNEEFEYDRYGETVTDIQNLSLVERLSGQVFVWNAEWQGD